MGVRFRGAWGRIRRRLQNVARWVQKPTEEELLQIAESLFDELRRRIGDNPPPKLAWTTVKKKEAMGAPFPTKTWFEWGRMHAARWNAEVESKRFGLSSVRLELDPTQRYPRGTPMEDVAKWLEYGTKTQPPRPVLRPMLADLHAGKVKPFEDWKQALRDRITASF